MSRLRATEDDLLQRRDRRAVFVTAYLEMSRRLEARLHSFEDPAWVERYAVGFANLYLTAYAAHESNLRPAVPRPWRIAFSLSQAGRVLVVQDLLLGINAHIGYDLPHALLSAGTAFDDLLRRADHVDVNRVLAEAVDPIQERIAVLYSPFLGSLDEALGSLDERVTAVSFSLARASAWRKARRLDGAAGRLETGDRERAIEEAAVCAARLLVAPNRLPRLFRALRRLESRGRWMEVYRDLEMQPRAETDRRELG